MDTVKGREGGLIDDVGEELTVNGIGDRTTDLNVGEILVARLNSSHWIDRSRRDRPVTITLSSSCRRRWRRPVAARSVSPFSRPRTIVAGSKSMIVEDARG